MQDNEVSNTTKALIAVIKLGLLAGLVALVLLVNYHPGQILIAFGGWWYLAGYLALIALAQFLLSKVTTGSFSLAAGALAILNPITILIVYTGLQIELGISVFMAFAMLFFGLFALSIWQANKGKFGKAILSAIAAIIVGGFDLLMFVKISVDLQNGFKPFDISDKVWEEFNKIWISYWREDVMLAVIAILILIFLLRIVLNLAGIKPVLLMRTVLGASVLFFVLLSALPVFQGNLIAPDFQIVEPIGFTELSQQLDNRNVQNLLLIQAEDQPDLSNLFLNSIEGEVISAYSRDANEAYLELTQNLREDKLLLDQLALTNISHIALVSLSETQDLSSLRKFAARELAFNEVELNSGDSSQVFLFENQNYEEVRYPNLSPNQIVPVRETIKNSDGSRTIKLTARQDYPVVTGNSASIHLELQQANQMTLYLNDTNKVPLFTFESDSSVFYVAVNDQVIGMLDTDGKALSIDETKLNDIRLYSKYDTTNVLGLSKFVHPTGCDEGKLGKVDDSGYSIELTGNQCIILASAKIESSASALLDITSTIQANTQTEICFYNLSKQKCIASFDSSKPKFTFEAGTLFNQELQIRLYIKRNVTDKLLNVNVSSMKLVEYELVKQQNLSQIVNKYETTVLKAGESITIDEN